MHLDAIVEDAAGRPMLGLDPWDFTLLDNGKPRKILSFHRYDGDTARPVPPVEVILLLDTVNIPFEQFAFTRKEIARFLEQNNGQLAHPVSLMLLTEAGLRLQPRPSSDGHALVSVLDQIKGGVHSITSAMGAGGELERMQISLRQISAIAENEARKPGRKLLIWVGPGWPLLDSRSFTFSDKDQRRYFDSIVELSTRIREARMSLYSVSAPWPGMGGAADSRFLYRDFLNGVHTALQADAGNLALKVLVTQSGGRIYGPDNELARQIDRCVADADRFYTLSFDPPAAVQRDEFHDLKLTVDKPGLTVRTTTGYYNQP